MDLVDFAKFAALLALFSSQDIPQLDEVTFYCPSGESLTLKSIRIRRSREAYPEIKPELLYLTIIGWILLFAGFHYNCWLSLSLQFCRSCQFNFSSFGTYSHHTRASSTYLLIVFLGPSKTLPKSPILRFWIIKIASAPYPAQWTKDWYILCFLAISFLLKLFFLFLYIPSSPTPPSGHSPAQNLTKLAVWLFSTFSSSPNVARSYLAAGGRLQCAL